MRTKEVAPESSSPIIYNVGGIWTITTSLTVGIAGLVLFLLTFFVFAYVWHPGSLLPADAYARLLLSTLVSLVAVIALLGPVTLCIAHRKGITDFWASIEWNANASIVRYLIIGAVLAVLYRLILKIAFGSAGSFLASSQPLTIGLYVAVVVLLQPAIEEVYFRGILLVGLERRLGTLPAIVIVTAVFALIHPRYQLYVLPVAITLGAARVKARSVAACFALHASYNLFLAIYQILFPS